MTVLFPSLAHLHRYRVVYADPPWQHDNYGQKKHGAAKAHYNEMSVDQICALPVSEIAAENAALALWSTVTASAEGQHARVMEAWGFKPCTKLFYWRKVYRKCACGHADDRHHRVMDPRGKVLIEGLCGVDRCHCTRFDPRPYCGTGSYTRSGGEDCWLGIRGGGMTPEDHGVYEEIQAPVTVHSEKPPGVRERIERLWPQGPYVELFGRGEPPPGWAFWGDEAEPCAPVFGEATEDGMDQGAAELAAQVPQREMFNETEET